MEYENKRRSGRNPIVTAILSYLIPGLGQMYSGRVISGVIWLVIVLAGYFLLFLPGLFLHFICVCSAYCLASQSSRPFFAGFAISLVLFGIWFTVAYYTLPEEVKESISMIRSVFSKSYRAENEGKWTFVHNGKEYSAEDNEKMAINALKKIFETEVAYKKKYGRYTHNFSTLMKVGLSGSIGAAEGNSMLEYYGYQFFPVKRHHTGWTDLENGFVMCAAPTVYKKTGTRTFVIGNNGKVLAKDIGGKPVSNVTQVNGTWIKQ